MAKSKKQKVKVATKAKKAAAAQRAPALDSGARAYMRLLRDPCTAPLVPPVYDNTQSGSMQLRFENQYTFSAAAGTTRVFFFCPALLSVSGAAGFFAPSQQPGSVFSLEPTGVANENKWYRVNTRQPGYGMLVQGAQTSNWSYRPVAGCAQLTYTGTELDRSGVVSMGIAQDIETLVSGDVSVTDAEVAEYHVVAQATERVQDGTAELNFVPGAGDRRFYDLNNEQTLATARGHGAVFFVISAGAKDIAFRLRHVAVYDVIPNALGSGGFTLGVAPSPSGNTFNGVMRAMGDIASWALRHKTQLASALGTAMASRAMRPQLEL